MSEITQNSRRPNPFFVPRPARKTKTVTLRDGEFEVAVTIAALDAVSSHRMQDLKGELIREYCGEECPLTVEDADVSENLCHNVAIVHTMVSNIDGGDPYRPEEYLAMAHTMPHLWLQFVAECFLLNREVIQNPATTPTDTSS
jgi:hypothetical protein